MLRLAKLLFMSVLLLGCMSFTQSNETEGVHFRNIKWNQIFKSAKNEQKPVFVFIGATYCGQT